MEEREHSDLALSPESLKALEEHQRLLDDDIAAGRFKPGDRRHVVLPNGDRFQIGHPDEAVAEKAQRKRSWWAKLLGRGRADTYTEKP